MRSACRCSIRQKGFGASNDDAHEQHCRDLQAALFLRWVRSATGSRHIYCRNRGRSSGRALVLDLSPDIDSDPPACAAKPPKNYRNRCHQSRRPGRSLGERRVGGIPVRIGAFGGAGLAASRGASACGTSCRAAATAKRRRKTCRSSPSAAALRQRFARPIRTCLQFDASAFVSQWCPVPRLCPLFSPRRAGPIVRRAVGTCEEREVKLLAVYS
jgi:hypothetical protein